MLNYDHDLADFTGLFPYMHVGLWSYQKSVHREFCERSDVFNVEPFVMF